MYFTYLKYSNILTMFHDGIDIVITIHNMQKEHAVSSNFYDNRHYIYITPDFKEKIDALSSFTTFIKYEVQ